MSTYTVPGIPDRHAAKAVELLTGRLHALLDLQLTLKHVHWNLVGPGFIGVHEMLDPHTARVRTMTDEVAERIAALGGTPRGTPGAIVDGRDWNDYSLDRATVTEHLAALDVAYTGLLNEQRHVIAQMGELDPVTEDLLVGHAGELEHFQWLVRAHLLNAEGHLPTHGTKTIGEAIAAVGGTTGIVTEPTRAAADRPPTPEEERAAERNEPVSERTAEAYKEMAEIGANVQGEGRID